MSGVRCHMSVVTFQVSCVMCPVTGVRFYFYFYKVVELVVGWSVMNESTPSSFNNDREQFICVQYVIKVLKLVTTNFQIVWNMSHSLPDISN